MTNQFRHPIKLNEMQEAILIKHWRDMWAKKLRKERNIFKEGLQSVVTYTQAKRNVNFIDSSTVTFFSHVGSIPFDELYSEVMDARFRCEPYDTVPDIVIEADHNDVGGCGGCYCGGCGDYDGVVSVQSIRYEFKKLSQVKSLIHDSRIKWALHDARFKLYNQPNGKDSARYLKIIENN